MAMVSSKIIDLSHKHGPNTFMVPGQPHYNRSNVQSVQSYTNVCGYYRVETGAYYSAEHGGTHIDAPSHFAKESVTLDDVPIENTIAEGVMIDVAEEAKINIEYQVTLAKVKEWEKKYGDIPKEAAVIFNFGWHKKFHNKTEYIDTETGSWDLIRHPSVSKEVGDYLYDQRNIKIIGTDTMTPDPVTLNGKKVDSMPIHQRYLPNNKLIVENLNATDSLPPRGFRFHAAPVKYLGASGAQVRAYAVLYENVSVITTACIDDVLDLIVITTACIGDDKDVSVFTTACIDDV
ncbi:hypothetical protein Btru_022832 [Bulinus truncatus]|nr:hypothetical protein Btru_022832 [Bulinus truncatus]